jgi:hypothetical protein
MGAVSLAGTWHWPISGHNVQWYGVWPLLLAVAMVGLRGLLSVGQVQPAPARCICLTCAGCQAHRLRGIWPETSVIALCGLCASANR